MFRSSSFTIGSQVEEKENMLDLIGNWMIYFNIDVYAYHDS